MVNIKDITLKEIITQRPDLIQAIKNNEDEGTTTYRTEKDEKGRLKKWVEEKRDIDGILVAKRVDEYSYYKTGEVDIITQQVFDAKKMVSEKSIKHFTDGRRPEVKVIEGG